MVEENKEVKETTEDWEEFVRSEVTAALNNFLPYSGEGKLGIIYKKSVVEETESGPVYDENKVSGVEIVISLEFPEAIDKVT